MLGRGSEMAIALAFGMLALPISSASAQEASASDSDQAVAEEEIVVTGTSIRGVAPVGSQLIQISQEDIQASGAQNTAALLASVPQLNSFGTTPRPGSDGANPTNPPSLRGLPPGATLNLLNGHRLVGLGTISTQADPSSIPIAAIERVEVLTDGASSTYGSDAVAGVINVILRRDLDGIDVQGTYGFADGYDEKQVSAVAGKTWDSGFAMIGYQYFQNSDLSGNDRGFVTSNLAGFPGGFDTRSAFALTPNVNVNGQDFNYNGTSFTPGLVRYDAARDSSLVPASKRHSAIANFRQDIGDSVELFGDANYGNIETVVLSPAQTAGLTITSANPYFQSPIAGATSATVNYRFNREYGATRNFNSVEYYGGRLGADFKISDKWNGQLYANYQHGFAEVFQGGGVSIDGAALNAALASTNPATAFDPFTGRTSAATLQAIRSGGINTPASNQTVFQVLGKVDGTVVSLAGGDVRAALGVEFRRETFYGSIDQSTPTTPNVVRAGGGRSIKSIYGELYIPLVSSANAVPGVYSLALNGTLRHDSYSDFGSTTNPKIGIEYAPVEELTLRANYSKSFRAPNLSDIYATDSRAQYIEGINVPDFFNPVAPGPRNGNYNILLLAGGNANLQPETASTYSIGADLKPTSNVRLSATYYNIKYENVINIAAGAFSNPALFSRFITANPTQAQVDAAVAQLPAIWGVPIPASQIDFIDDLRRYNLGAQNIEGLDFSADIRIPTTSAGTFNVGGSGNYLLTNETQPATGAAFIDNLQLANPRWRMRGYVNWSNSSWTANLFVNHIGSFNNPGVSPVQRVKSWTTFDANIGYDFGELFGTRGTSIQLYVQNLFDKDPPQAFSSPGFIQSYASPLGRMVQVSVRTKF
jgi:iron complex outermembrane receptor protein